jgi:FkbM family methyltransferase
MEIIPWLYGQAAKGFRNEPARKMKDKLRPIKHALVGKQGIYKAIGLLRGDIKVIFDVGAAIGEASLPLARAFPDAQIYAFEPLPESFELLVKRTKKFSDRFHYFNTVLTDRPGALTFYVREDHHDASSLLPQAPGLKSHEIVVPSKRLDDVCAAIGVTHIDFLKVDVEGMEKEMLAGAREILRHTNNVFVEISPERKGYNHDYIDVFEYLHAAGLSFVGVHDDYLFSRMQ